ncbi:MAG: hypothetical protein WCF33_12780 [Pseudonocardiaceae bacterium]
MAQVHRPIADRLAASTPQQRPLDEAARALGGYVIPGNQRACLIRFAAQRGNVQASTRLAALDDQVIRKLSTVLA